MGRVLAAPLILLAATGCAQAANPAVPSTPPALSSPSPPVPSPPALSSPSTRVITVTSAAFPVGGRIPARFTCDGAGTPPPLVWSGAPRSARSFAVVVSDPDAPNGTYTHWIVAGLSPTTTSLDGPHLPPGAVQATTSAGRPGYAPPCPPSGTHHYRFTVLALDVAQPIPDGAGLSEALSGIDADTVASGTLVGRYSRR